MNSTIHDKPKKRRNIAALAPVLPRLAAAGIRLLHRTCRFKIVGEENWFGVNEIEAPKIAAFWHFTYPTILYFFRDRGYLTITSRSRDGEFAAKIVESLGFFAFRGSPGKGGAAALKSMISVFKKSAGGGIVADGSQGPAEIAQKGLLVLAMYSGSPIIPVSFAADRCRRLRSWDKTMIPMPFSRIVVSYGPHIRVERNASSEEIEKYRVQLDRTLNEITARARKEAGAFA
ncbi:MAG: lysophospholipid acyltransferase family protein [Syntrophobacteraceae bacterium]|nr:lysophospholipid acyltransferase family protein [Syntrophobacteraceae bacterium]